MAIFLITRMEGTSGAVRDIGAAVSRAWESARMSVSTRRKINKLDDDPVKNLPIPILLGVEVKDIYDSWGDERSGGREHEGTDIMAPRGALIVSPTDAVVTSIGTGGNGGNYVYTANPGGERFYFAHLDSIKEDLRVGDELAPGDLIGYVGNTGNASGGATHLHLGIYKRGATNPYPRLTKTFSLKERIAAVEAILGESDDKLALVKTLIGEHRALFVEAKSQKIRIPKAIDLALQTGITPAMGVRDLTLGSQGPDVVALQEFLIDADSGTAARALSTAGASGYFGPMTQAALAEYQKKQGITPSTGYLGPATRAAIEENR